MDHEQGAKTRQESWWWTWWRRRRVLFVCGGGGRWKWWEIEIEGPADLRSLGCLFFSLVSSVLSHFSLLTLSLLSLLSHTAHTSHPLSHLSYFGATATLPCLSSFPSLPSIPIDALPYPSSVIPSRHRQAIDGRLNAAGLAGGCFSVRHFIPTKLRLLRNYYCMYSTVCPRTRNPYRPTPKNLESHPSPPKNNKTKY